jgi:hypothetical protein
VRPLIEIRDALSPSTKLMANEFGTELAHDIDAYAHEWAPSPPYQQAAAAVFVYAYLQLAVLGSQ